MKDFLGDGEGVRGHGDREEILLSGSRHNLGRLAWPGGPLGSTADLPDDFACYNQPSFALQYLQHQDLPGSVDMVVSILTMGYWPTYTPVEVHLPSEVMSIMSLKKV